MLSVAEGVKLPLNFASGLTLSSKIPLCSNLKIEILNATRHPKNIIFMAKKQVE